MATMKALDPTEVVTVGPAARQLGVSTERVRQWIRDGRLEAHRGPLGYRLIPAAAVERLVKERAASGRTAFGR